MMTLHGGADGRRSSQEPADQLVRELLANRRAATAPEIKIILHRIAGAPFNARPMSVPIDLVGRTYRGQILPERADSLSVHLWRRVLVDEQWAPGTTADEYLADLRRAIRDPAAHLAIYTLRDSPHAILVGPSGIPAIRCGSRPGTLIVVPYSVNGGMLTSGYQIHDLASLTLSPSRRWLT